MKNFRNSLVVFAISLMQIEAGAADLAQLKVACRPIDATSYTAITSETIWIGGCKSKKSSDFHKIWSELQSRKFKKQINNFSSSTVRVGMKLNRQSIYIDTEYHVMMINPGGTSYFLIEESDHLRASILSTFGIDEYIFEFDN
jgi:hypothetical protein